MLPILTTHEDVINIVEYLKKKRLGVSISDARAVIGNKLLDPRKMSAYRQWKVIKDEGKKIKLGDSGVIISRGGDHISKGFLEIIKFIHPYRAFIESIYYHGALDSIDIVDVIRFWHEHFKEDIGDKEDTINAQAVCFFRVCEGANLGKVKKRTKGSNTRLEINRESLESSINQIGNDSTEVEPMLEVIGLESKKTILPEHEKGKKNVYISHGKNRKFLEPISALLEIADLDAVISIDTESVSKSLSEKILSEMKRCSAAIIHIEDEMHLKTENGQDFIQLNPNVLIEIGAALALFDHNFILLVKDGVELPTNLSGLYEVRYSGDTLEASDAIRLIKAIKEFE